MFTVVLSKSYSEKSAKFTRNFVIKNSQEYSLQVLKKRFLYRCTVASFTKFFKTIICKNRNSHRRCFIKKGFLKNFVNFTRKALVLESLYNKVTA